MKQEEIVFKVLEELGGIARSEEIKRACLNEYNGVSCPDRYIRWMAERNIIKNIGKAKSGDRTDTWKIIAPYKTAAERRSEAKETLFDMEKL